MVLSYDTLSVRLNSDTDSARIDHICDVLRIVELLFEVNPEQIVR
jgi:hypothetical protein